MHFFKGQFTQIETLELLCGVEIVPVSADHSHKGTAMSFLNAAFHKLSSYLLLVN